MSLTKVLPLGMNYAWYSSVSNVSAVLLRDDVTSVPDAAAHYSDISGLEVSDTSGGYRIGGVNMSAAWRTENPGAGVVEWDVQSPTWSSAPFTLSGFRWVVLIRGTGGGAPILAVHDLGGTQSVTDELLLGVTESPYSPGVFPILRMKRALT